MPGAATQVFSREFDAALAPVPTNISALILGKITEMGRRLESFPHYRMIGRTEFRLRVGDYRVIYDFDTEKNEIYLITLGIGARCIGKSRLKRTTENNTRRRCLRPKHDTNLKLARFPARSALPVAALPSMSLIPSARFTN
jgi:mRNA-degrading endonuclease RelE of RelBE toxin-antitoxin system